MWGKKTRVFTGFKKYYEYLIDEYPMWFSANTTAFELCAALGISHNKQINSKRNEDLANIPNLDSAVFYPILSQKYPNYSPEERLEELEKYAEYGVTEFYKEIKENGQIGFYQYLKSAFDGIDY